MAKNIKDAIVDLSKGKGSKLRIGSRATPHRLRNEERLLLDSALKKGFLELQAWHRENLKNIYLKLCYALRIKPVICKHGFNESEVLYYNSNINKDDSIEEFLKNNFTTSTFSSKKDAKLFSKSIRFQLNTLV